jgi:uncharacterized protein YaiI (UPF0178 family)
MRIWVDADACPSAIKDILFRAAERAQVHVTLVANQVVRVPSSPFLHFVQVASGFNAADARIVELAEANDLVITADIPLAAAVVAKGAHALNPRGERYTAENVRERLSIRDFLEELRGGGVKTGGPAAMNARDRQAFANQLDSILAKRNSTPKVPP